MLRTQKAYSILTAATALLLPSTAAHAAGFYLQETSVVGTGMAYAGSTTSINNAQTVYSNPAGIADLGGTQVSAGVQALIPYATIDNTTGAAGNSGGNPYNLVSPLPNLYATHALNKNLTLGLGVTTPFGLSEEYKAGWFGQANSTKTDLKVVDVTPVFGYKINPQLSVGGGLDIEYVTARLEHMAAGVAPAALKGEDTSVGFNLGVKYAIDKATTVGATYRSAVTHKLDGSIILGAPLGPLAHNGTAKLKLPDIESIGLEHKLDAKTRLMASITRYGWDRFKSIDAIDTDGGALSSSIDENYHHTVSFAIGGEYDLNPQWTVRAGYQYDPTPTRAATRDTLVPDGNRNYFAVGATHKLTKESSIDLAAAYINMSHEEVNGSAAPLPTTVQGKSTGRVGILSAAYNYTF